MNQQISAPRNPDVGIPASEWLETVCGCLDLRRRHQKTISRDQKKLDDGWPESEKDVIQAALRMVVVKDSR